MRRRHSGKQWIANVGVTRTGLQTGFRLYDGEISRLLYRALNLIMTWKLRWSELAGENWCWISLNWPDDGDEDVWEDRAIGMLLYIPDTSRIEHFSWWYTYRWILQHFTDHRGMLSERTALQERFDSIGQGAIGPAQGWAHKKTDFSCTWFV